MEGGVGTLADQLVQAASEGDEDEFAELFDKLGEKDKSKLIQLLGGGAPTPGANSNSGGNYGALRGTIPGSLNKTADTRSALQQMAAQESPTTAFWGGASGASGTSAASGAGEGTGDLTDGAELQSIRSSLLGLDMDDLDAVVNRVA
jgi:hypothetical protein